MKKLSLIIAVICLLLTSFSNCSFTNDSEGGYNIVFDEDTFLQQQAAWQKYKPANYRYEFRLWHQSYIYDVAITVQGGVAEVQCADDDLFSQSEYPSFNSIDTLYAAIYTEYKKYKDIIDAKEKVYDLQFYIAYDKTYHYPVQVSCSIWEFSDNWYSWSVHDVKFTLLE